MTLHPHADGGPGHPGGKGKENNYTADAAL